MAPVEKKEKRARFPLARVLVVFSILIMILNGAIVIHRSVFSYNESLVSGKEFAEKLMHKISDHVELTFLAVDLTLRRAVERQYFNALFGNNLKEDMQHNFMTWVNTTPQISAMLMTDENGKVVAIYTKDGHDVWVGDVDSIATRDYFLVHKDNDDPDFVYSTAIGNQVGEDGTALMSRRLSNLNGSFGGVVVAAMKNSYLVDYFETIEGDKETNFILTDHDNNILINHKYEDAETEDLLERLEYDHRTEYKSVYAISSVIDAPDSQIDSNDAKIFVFRNVPNFNLTISLTFYGKDIFAVWREDRIHDSAFFGMFALFALVISFFATVMSKQMQRVESSEETAVMASQTKSEFLANMSHELRTPLNAIIGFSEMLDSGYFGKLNAKQKERVTDINLCGYHLLELINDVLEFSKGEAGKIELRQEKMHVVNTVDECIRIMNERAKQQGIKIVKEVPGDLPHLYADSRKFKQVLLNLLSNAVKFTKRDGAITVSSYVDEAGDFVLAVADTGIGMKEEDIPKALSVFGQVHGDAKFGGTGLGLPLCKMFVELHGGKIDIESQKDIGTTVYITLPSARVIWADSNGKLKHA